MKPNLLIKVNYRHHLQQAWAQMFQPLYHLVNLSFPVRVIFSGRDQSRWPKSCSPAKTLVHVWTLQIQLADRQSEAEMS